MGATENARYNAKIQRNLGLFCNKTAQIIAKTSTILQLSVSDMLTLVNFPTFAVVDLHYGWSIRSIRSILPFSAEDPRPPSIIHGYWPTPVYNPIGISI